MATSVKKVIVDTDLIVEHVMGSVEGGPSRLRRIMSQAFCYTTVFNAIEAFSLCRSDIERRAIEDAMSALKILGVNARSSKAIGRSAEDRNAPVDLQVLVAGVCRESRLPLVTGRPEKYRSMKGLELLPVRSLLAAGGRVRRSRSRA